MNKIKLLFVMFVLAGVGFFLLNANARYRSVEQVFTTVKTLSAVKQQLRIAKAKQRPAMLEFYASWCSVCRWMDRTVLSDATIQKRLRHVAAIRVDVTEQDEEALTLLNYFRVEGTPTFIFYDKNGQAGDTIIGGVSKPVFAKALDAAVKQ